VGAPEVEDAAAGSSAAVLRAKMFRPSLAVAQLEKRFVSGHRFSDAKSR